jgi:hypothetical protein
MKKGTVTIEEIVEKLNILEKESKKDKPQESDDLLKKIESLEETNKYNRTLLIPKRRMDMK